MYVQNLYTEKPQHIEDLKNGGIYYVISCCLNIVKLLLFSKLIIDAV